MSSSHSENIGSLLEDAYTAYFSKDVKRLRQICERGIGLRNISGNNEAAFRKLYAFALCGLSLQDDQDKLILRQRALDEAKKAIGLYGDSADPIALSQCYEIYGNAAQLYSIALSGTNQKNQLLREAISAYERALQLNPSNSGAQRSGLNNPPSPAGGIRGIFPVFGRLGLARFEQSTGSRRWDLPSLNLCKYQWACPVEVHVTGYKKRLL